MNRIPFLSVIIPVYNEEKRIENILKIDKFLKKKKIAFELVVINDGSIDNTLKRIRSVKEDINFNLISFQKNKGKGYAVKQGMLNSKGKYRLFMDIDLSTPIEEIVNFLPFLKKYEVMIGSRRIKGARFEKRQPFIRESLGKGFTFLSKIILKMNISDFTCGFKCFTDQAANEIFSRQLLKRWSFDSEILFIANKLNYRVKEVPVSWYNNPGTKVRFPQDIIHSFFDLLKIRYYNMKEKYN